MNLGATSDADRTGLKNEVRNRPGSRCRVLTGTVCILAILTCSLITVSDLQAAIFVVNTLADVDDGECLNDCSIREALNLSQDGDTINILPGTYRLTTGQLKVEKSITINGVDPKSAVIDGMASFRIFEIGAGSTVRINNLMMTKGKNTNGGGICNAGVLTITNCIISKNQGQYGSGIYNLGELKILRSAITANGTQYVKDESKQHLPK